MIFFSILALLPPLSSLLFHHNNVEPVQQIAIDVLERKVFAKKLAIEIFNSQKDITNPDARSLALCGEWGCGKTWIIDETTKNLCRKSNNIVVKLNVHQFEDLGKLHLHFFNTILNALNKNTYTPRLDAFYILKSFVNFLTHGIDIEWISNKAFTLPQIDTYLKTYSSWLAKSGYNLVCFIDDVDRIKDPNDIDDVLKLINLVKNNMDYTILVTAIDLTHFLKSSSKSAVTVASSKTIGKYFDAIYKIPESNINIREITNSFLFSLIRNFDVKGSNRQSSGIKDLDTNDARFYALNYLKTIRDLLEFKKMLSDDFSRLRDTIRFSDLIILSLIKTLRYDTFEFIRQNRAILIPDIIDTNFITTPDSSPYFKSFIIRGSNYLKNNFVDDLEKALIFKLFPYFSVDLDLDATTGISGLSISRAHTKFEELVINRGFATRLLSEKYFSFELLNEDNPEEFPISVKYQELLINEFSSKLLSPNDAYHKLAPFFPPKNSNIELFNYSCWWLLKTSRSNPFFPINYLSGFSHVVREYILSFNRVDSLLIYIKQLSIIFEQELNKGSNLIMFLSDEDGSDYFVATLISLLNDSVRSKVKNDEINKLEAACSLFIQRMVKKLQKSTLTNRLFDDFVTTYEVIRVIYKAARKENIVPDSVFNLIFKHLESNSVDRIKLIEKAFESAVDERWFSNIDEYFEELNLGKLKSFLKKNNSSILNMLFYTNPEKRSLYQKWIFT